MDGLSGFEKFISLIKEDVTLSDELRKEYINAVTDLSIGKALEYDTAASLIGYIDDVYQEAGDNALASGDPDLIDEVAEARMEKDVLVSLIVGSGVDGLVDDLTEKDQKAIENILNRIQSMAKSTPVPVSKTATT